MNIGTHSGLEPWAVGSIVRVITTTGIVDFCWTSMCCVSSTAAQFVERMGQIEQLKCSQDLNEPDVCGTTSSFFCSNVLLKLPSLLPFQVLYCDGIL